MSKYAQYFAIEKTAKSKGMNVDRADMISTFTGGNKTSLTDLSAHEYKEFVSWLNRTVQGAPYNTEWKNTPENVMRRKIIALMYKMGYSVSLAGYKRISKADMPKIKQWVLKYGNLHKDLNEYTVEELPELVTQVELRYQKHLENYG